MDMAAIKKLHAELYGEFTDRRQQVLKNREAFERKAAALLDQVQNISSEVTSVEDYDWLRATADKWRAVYTYTLNIPKDISLLPPGQALVPPIPKQDAMIWSEAVLGRWVQDQAYEAAKRRALQRFQALTPEEMLRKLPSSGDEEHQDWRDANAQLAYEIFDGRIALSQIHPQSYWRLEQCWLEDIKRVKAYHVWLDRGNGWDAEHAQDNYYEACRQVSAKLSGRMKLDTSEFTPVSDYLETKYLSDDHVDLQKSEPLITAKARRLWETTGENDSEKNWFIAVDYVREFYGKITPAICAEDLQAHERVTEMLQATDERHLIINVLEMAIAVCFLRTREVLLAGKGIRTAAA